MCACLRHIRAKDMVVLQMQNGVMKRQAFPSPFYNLFEFVTGNLKTESSPLSS